MEQHEPQDCVAFMDRARTVALVILLAVVAAVAWKCVAPDAAPAPTMPAAEPIFPLAHPLPYAISVTHSGYGIDQPRERFVVPRD